MDVYVDDKPLDSSALRGGTLEEAIRTLQTQVCTPQRIFVSFRCDGTEMIGEAMAAALRKPLAAFDRLELFTSTKEDLVTETMEQAQGSLDDTEAVTQAVAAMLVEGKTPDAIRKLGECLRVWQQVHDAVSKSLLLLDLDPERTKIRDEPLSTALLRPKDVLTQIKAALHTQDHVLLADLLQYEFAEVTELWHLLIARLRREADDRRDAVLPQ